MYKQEIQTLTQEKESLEKQISEIQKTNLHSLDSVQKRHDREIAVMKRRIKMSEDKASGIEKKRDEFQKQIFELEAKGVVNKDNAKKIKDLKNVVLRLKTNLDKATDKTDDLESQLRKMKATIVSYGKNENIHKSEIKSLQNKLQEKENEKKFEDQRKTQKIKNLETQVQDKETRIVELQNMVLQGTNTNASELLTSEKEKTRLRKEKIELHKQLNELRVLRTEELRQIKNSLDSDDDVKMEDEEERNKKSHEMTEILNKIAEFSDSLQKKEEEIALSKTQLANQKTQLDEIKQSLDDAQSKYDTLSQQYNDQDTELKNAKTRLAALNTEKRDKEEEYRNATREHSENVKKKQDELDEALKLQEQIKGKYETLQSDYDILEEKHKRETQAAEERFASYQKRYLELQQQNLDANQQLTTAQQKTREEQDTNFKIFTELERVRVSLKNTQAALQRSERDLEVTLQGKSNELQKLTQDRIKEINELQQKLTEKEKENVEIKLQVKQFQQLADAHEIARKTLEDDNNKIAKEKDKISADNTVLSENLGILKKNTHDLFGTFNEINKLFGEKEVDPDSIDLFDMEKRREFQLTLQDIKTRSAKYLDNVTKKIVDMIDDVKKLKNAVEEKGFLSDNSLYKKLFDASGPNDADDHKDINDLHDILNDLFNQFEFIKQSRDSIKSEFDKHKEAIKKAKNVSVKSKPATISPAQKKHLEMKQSDMDISLEDIDNFPTDMMDIADEELEDFAHRVTQIVQPKIRPVRKFQNQDDPFTLREKRRQKEEKRKAQARNQYRADRLQTKKKALKQNKPEPEEKKSIADAPDSIHLSDHARRVKEGYLNRPTVTERIHKNRNAETAESMLEQLENRNEFQILSEVRIKQSLDTPTVHKPKDKTNKK